MTLLLFAPSAPHRAADRWSSPVKYTVTPDEWVFVRADWHVSVEPDRTATWRTSQLIVNGSITASRVRDWTIGAALRDSVTAKSPTASGAAVANSQFNAAAVIGVVSSGSSIHGLW